MKTFVLGFFGLFGAVAVAAAPVQSTAHPPTPTSAQYIQHEEIQKMIREEVSAQIQVHDTRIQNNSDFDPSRTEFQPYYVPIMAQSELGTFLTVSNISAQVGSFSSGITVSDSENGEPFCIAVTSGTVVAQAGGC